MQYIPKDSQIRSVGGHSSTIVKLVLRIFDRGKHPEELTRKVKALGRDLHGHCNNPNERLDSFKELSQKILG